MSAFSYSFASPSPVRCSYQPLAFCFVIFSLFTRPSCASGSSLVSNVSTGVFNVTPEEIHKYHTHWSELHWLLHRELQMIHHKLQKERASTKKDSPSKRKRRRKSKFHNPSYPPSGSKARVGEEIRRRKKKERIITKK